MSIIAASTARHTGRDNERIAAIRRRTLERKDRGISGWSLQANPVVTARALRQTEAVPSWQRRRGAVVGERLRATRFALDEWELMAGRVDEYSQEGDPAAQEEARRYLQQYPEPGGQTGHCELDLESLMQLGIDGLAARIRARRERCDSLPAGRQQRTDGTEVQEHTPEPDALDSFLDSLDGLAAMITNAATPAVAALSGATPARQAELRTLIDSCRRIAHQPPTSFRDAIQLLWLTILGVMHGEPVGLVVPGHLDRTLYPFYRRDRDNGTLDDAEALLLIESLYLQINAYIPDGLAISVMVGGRDEQDADVTNELSYLCLEALRRTALIYPTVGICWHEDTPAALVELAVDLIGHGNANPAFFGDATIRQGLRDLGVPSPETCRYVNSTCVEITPAGASNVWVASPYYNLCQLLLDEIDAQVPDPAPDFAAFKHHYRERLASAVEGGVAQQNQLRQRRRLYGRKPLQSVFTRNCLERGRDIDDGGAGYNWVECSFVGLANLADSLQVIETEIYQRGALGFDQLKNLLDADFAGAEPLRQRFLHDHPKYGQGVTAVDKRVAATVAWLTALCRRFRMEPDDSPYVPGAFVWIMHERLGRETGATPDGRHAGFPFADGCGPAQGRESQGPTAAILSTTSWDHSPMIGGLAFNMKFNHSLLQGPQGYDRLRDLILAFLRRGGFETQVNVVDAQVLHDARKHPEQYRDLVVRIGGYTDYFTRLSPQMQAEVILRTEYADA